MVEYAGGLKSVNSSAALTTTIHLRDEQHMATFSVLKQPKLRHGHTRNGRRTPEHSSWTAMLKRCSDPNHAAFPRYGGRGISVCDRWLLFENFLTDMGPRPSLQHSLDRYPNNDGNYEPGNVRWATKAEQGTNKHNNRLVTFNGETLPGSEWERRLGFGRELIYQRMDRGWSAERAITTPVPKKVAR